MLDRVADGAVIVSALVLVVATLQETRTPKDDPRYPSRWWRLVWASGFAMVAVIAGCWL